MRWLKWVFVLALLGVFIAPVAAQDQENVVNDPTVEWSFTPVYGEVSKQGSWIPLVVRLKNSGTDRVFDVVANDRYVTSVDVPGGGDKEVTVFLFQNMTSRIKVNLMVGPTIIASERVLLRNTNDQLIGDWGVSAQPNLTNFKFISLKPQTFPKNPLALEMLDALQLNFEIWNSLNLEQQQAIKSWVAEGGTLIAAPDLLANLPSELVPAKSGALRTFQLGDIFADNPELVLTQPLNGIQLLPEPTSQVWLEVASGPVVVAQPYGAGNVVTVAIDVNDGELLRWNLAPMLWPYLLPEDTSIPVWQRTENPQAMTDNQVSTFLNNLPVLDMPPLQLLLIVLGIYVVLVGPVNYFILRKLDRVAMAWLTIPVLTLIFAGLTFGIGAKQRGSDIIVNELLIINQPLNNQPAQFIEGYGGVFSPHQTTYTVIGTDDTRFRELMSSFSTQASAHRFSSNPAQIQNLRVNQWSMESFGFIQSTTHPPAIEINVSVEDDFLVGSVRNTGPVALADCVIILGNTFQRLDRIEPGATATINLNLNNESLQNALSYMVYQKELDAGYQRPEGPSRELLARTQAIDSVTMDLQYLANQPVFLAFAEFDQPTTISLVDQRYAKQRMTLFISKPELQFSAGSTVEISSSMVGVRNLSQNINGEDWCMTQNGTGIGLTPEGADIEMTLPAAASKLEDSKITLTPFVDGMFVMNDLSFAIYNWKTQNWQEQPAGEKRFMFDSSQYIRNGRVRLRVQSTNNQGRPDEWWGCFSPGLSLNGRMP